MRAYTIIDLVSLLGVNGAARHLGISPRTVRRWRDNDTKPAPYLARLIHLETCLARGDLAAFGRHAGQFAGWRIYAGELKTPGGDTLTPGDCLATIFYRLNGRLHAGRASSSPPSSVPSSARPVPAALRLPWKRYARR